jgi:hypothetical protein
MPVKVSWYEPEHIILYVVSDPVTIEDLEQGSERVWALAAGIPDLVDMIFDYRAVTEFPRGVLPVFRDGSLGLPTLDRVALVGSEPLVEMMVATIARNTYRPDPSIHASIEEAADYLRRAAQEE